MERRKQSRALQIEQLIRERDALAKALASEAAAEREEREEIEAKLAITGDIDQENGGLEDSMRVSGLRGHKVELKYQNPENESETWTGRGLMPRWLAAQVKAGKQLESFTIKR